MKIIKNISQSTRGVPGIGEVRPGESVTVDDEMGNSCLTSPSVWEVTGIEPIVTIKKEKLSAKIKEKINIAHPGDAPEDLNNGSNE